MIHEINDVGICSGRSYYHYYMIQYYIITRVPPYRVIRPFMEFFGIGTSTNQNQNLVACCLPSR